MNKNISRKMSYLLRHNSEDLSIDKEGWIKTADLLNKLKISFAELKNIVNNNDKKRFSFDESEQLIRANQGHSSKLNLDIKYDIVQFPQTYFHGTAVKNVKSIMKNGLLPQTRDKVHLSKDLETARNVGLRHAKTLNNLEILTIDGNQMKKDGLNIYESKNGVILVDNVPPKYIS